MANNDWLSYLAFGGGIPALLIGWWMWKRYQKAGKPSELERMIPLVLMLVGIALTLGGGYYVLQTLKVIQ